LERTLHSRRQFCLLLSGAALHPLAGSADSTQRARIGFLSGGDADAAAPFIDAFRRELAARGYVEPGSLSVELRFADYAMERIPLLVQELERRNVALIITHAGATGIVVKGEHTVPIVYEFSADPTFVGIATDLAHPLYNATGITLMLAELNGKRLELLHEISPAIRRIAVLSNALHPGEQLERATSDAKARQLGFGISLFQVRNDAELGQALAHLAVSPPDALLVFSDTFVVENRRKIIDVAFSRGIPVVSGWSVMADSGALFTYGPRLVESYRRVGYFVDRILRGAKPAELPIEQPSVLELVVNLASAKRLGLTIPGAVLARADRVID
jgi:putative ABC transport system substrate-binding protein